MKKILAVVLVVAIALIAATAMAGIQNTKHDLSSSSTSGGYKSNTNQICEFCHTPHAAASNLVPLWNRTGFSGTYTVYSSATLSATPATTLSNRISGACMSCHDGTLATQSVVNQPNSGNLTAGNNTATVIGGVITSGPAALGTNLSDDHPVAFSYNESDTDLKAKSGVTAAGIKFFGNNKDQLECASCHAVHNNTYSPFLRLSNSASGLCLTCHNK